MAESLSVTLLPKANFCHSAAPLFVTYCRLSSVNLTGFDLTKNSTTSIF